jgi:exopolysaccharide biosynthesis glucuronosyltransferase PssD
MPLTANNSPRPKLMAIASGGGHWVQLLRLTPAFVNCDVTFVSVDEFYRSQVPQQKFYVVNDATRWNKFGLIRMSMKLAWLILMNRPDIIISTGAAPGYVGLRLGRLLGARTIWIDSIANVERLSLSGQKIGRYADLWLTQWPHLAQTGGPHYSGAVI